MTKREDKDFIRDWSEGFQREKRTRALKAASLALLVYLILVAILILGAWLLRGDW